MLHPYATCILFYKLFLEIFSETTNSNSIGKRVTFKWMCLCPKFQMYVSHLSPKHPQVSHGYFQVDNISWTRHHLAHFWQVCSFFCKLYPSCHYTFPGGLGQELVSLPRISLLSLCIKLLSNPGTATSPKFFLTDCSIPHLFSILLDSNTLLVSDLSLLNYTPISVWHLA